MWKWDKEGGDVLVEKVTCTGEYYVQWREEERKGREGGEGKHLKAARGQVWSFVSIETGVAQMLW